MSKNFNNPRIEFDGFERPANPRQRELQSRYEVLNDEERAELMGLNIFPDNPRGAELRKKEALGLIGDEEKEELRRLYQEKGRQEEMSPTIQKLWERVEAGDPNVTQVDMSDGKAVEVSPTDAEKIIWTFGLLGCYCSIVFAEHEDGTRNCVLTHYPPGQLSANRAKLGDLVGASKKMKTAKITKVVLAMPGEWTRDTQAKKYEMKTKNQQAVDALTNTIQVELGTDVEIKLEPYSENRKIGEKDQGTLVVYVLPSGKGDVRYQTWYGSGNLTENPEAKQ